MTGSPVEQNEGLGEFYLRGVLDLLNLLLRHVECPNAVLLDVCARLDDRVVGLVRDHDQELRHTVGQVDSSFDILLLCVLVKDLDSDHLKDHGLDVSEIVRDAAALADSLDAMPGEFLRWLILSGHFCFVRVK